MKSLTLVFAAGTLIAAAHQASAADIGSRMPVKALAPVAASLPAWSGFYLGGHAGYLWGHTQQEEFETGTIGFLGPTNGFVGGILGGLNWQMGSLVLGAEADFGWSNARGSSPGLVDPAEFFSYKIRWTSHVRARIGADFYGTLLYVAGGLAIADAQVEETEPTVPPAVVCGGIYTGWSIGSGVERMLTSQISGRLEYLYDDFGSKTYTMPDDTYRVSIQAHTLRGALVVRFPSR